MSAPFESYLPRSIRFGDVWQMGPWRLKAYGVAPLGQRVAPRLWLAAQDAVRLHLAKGEISLTHYGLGFVIVREHGALGSVALFQWVDETDLLQRAFVSDAIESMALRDLGGEGSALSVWDLFVLSFERHAWTAYVLNNPDGPDFGAYLSARVDEDV